jgi:hypothetical protein
MLAVVAEQVAALVELVALVLVAQAQQQHQ